jgi:uncharacterized repeat protein (TIGR02543 family)
MLSELCRCCLSCADVVLSKWLAQESQSSRAVPVVSDHHVLAEWADLSVKGIGGALKTLISNRIAAHHIGTKSVGAVLLVGSLAAGMCFIASAPSEAATILFASASGSGSTCSSGEPCSLTEALSTASSGSTVELSSGTYVGNFIVSSPSMASFVITIEPIPGQTEPVELNGDGTGTVLTVANDDTMLTLDNLQITGGTAESGGGIDNAGTLTLDNSTVYSNTSDGDGGGVFNGDQMTMVDSTIDYNIAGGSGGGVANAGMMTIEDSLVYGNETSANGPGGGGIYNGIDSSNATMLIENSNITNNYGIGTLTQGGGIYNASSATIEQSTISGNGPTGEGSGFYNVGTTTVAADILAAPGGPPAAGECAGSAVIDHGYNVADDGSCGFTAPSSVNNSPAIDDYLGTVNYFGGPTYTVPLLANPTVSPSPGPDPALGVIPATFDLPTGEAACSNPDERGVARSAPCDMGGFEIATDMLTFNSEGGNAVASLSGLDGTTVTLPSAPSYPGYTFAGWNTEANGSGTNYSAGATYTLSGSVTLYAQWTANPTTSVLIPSKGTTLSGSTYLDASGSNATSVKFLLLGGTYGFSAPVICTTTPTIYGWLCAWNTTTVPNGNYILVSEASNSSGNAFSSGVSVTVNNLHTTVLVPSGGATLRGTSTALDAVAAGRSTVTGVTFIVSGGSLSNHVVGTAVATIYGWIALWNTTTVPDGTYTLQSLATDAAGDTAYSPAITITVEN